MREIDYDIHGLVGVRLLDPTDGDIAAVDRQLGPMRRRLKKAPDIIIRFERRMELFNLRYLGLNCGFNDEGYYILRSSKADAKVRIPFDRIGGKCEIVCESGLRSVPLLIAIVNVTMVKKKCVPLHASAFVYENQGILVTGWSKGGKTEAMLSFTHQGATYVGDEWVILTGDGKRMYGLPEPVTVWDWHMDYLPEIRKKVSANKARIIRGVKVLDSVHQSTQRSFLKNSFAAKTLKEAMPAFKRQTHVNIPPQKLFADTRRQASAPIDKVVFIMSQASPEIQVEKSDTKLITERMISSIEYEQLPLQEHYLTYKFAFPGKGNEFLEKIRTRQYALLRSALASKEAYEVRHPYPVSLPGLFAEMSPYLKGSNANGAS